MVFLLGVILLSFDCVNACLLSGFGFCGIASATFFILVGALSTVEFNLLHAHLSLVNRVIHHLAVVFTEARSMVQATQGGPQRIDGHVVVDFASRHSIVLLRL